MIDLEFLFLSLMERSLPGRTIRIEHDTNEIDDFPVVLIGVIGGANVANEDGTPTAWTVTLTAAAAALTKQEAAELMRDVYAAVWSWETGRFDGANVIDDVGVVIDINDASVPTLVPSPDVEGAQVSQYAGGWSMIAAAP